MKTLKFAILLSLFLLVLQTSKAQESQTKTVTVIPAVEYEAGAFFKFFFGEHWRKLWTTPIEVEVLDLNSFAGGLTPFEKGGGFQTKSLKFQGADGNIWKFRSVRKDPSKVLPEELQETVMADVMFDQISSSNPFGALVVVPMLNAVGVLQSAPKVVWLGDDPKLGEFRNDFKNMLGLLEIHPNENEKDSTMFNGATKISGTYSLLNKLEEKRNEKVNSKAYLTARLMDAFFGDWDRHTDQWRWAKINNNTEAEWYPIPRDRDQVFSLYDGVLPKLAVMFVRQLNSFGCNYPPAKYLSWSGRVLDNRFLSTLSKTEWDSVTNFIKNKLTDSLITYSVHLLPKEHIKIAGEYLINCLKNRRDLLLEYSDEYYSWIHQIVEIHGTVKDDYALVNRLSDSTTQVLLYKKSKKNDYINQTPYYSNTFLNNECEEIRLFLLEGDDEIIVKGNVESSPYIKVSGGDGKDSFIDSSHVNGYLFSFLPIPNAENKTIFYDGGEHTLFKTGAGTIINKDKEVLPKTDEERFEPTYIQRGYDLSYLPNIEYNRSNGLIMGIGPEYTSYNFRMNPYDYRLSFTAKYATVPKTYHLVLHGEFNNIIKNTIISVDLFRTKLLLTNYYGYGNLTSYKHNLDEKDYYKTNQEVTKANLGIAFNITNNLSSQLSFEYKYLETIIYNNSIVNLIPQAGYGLGGFHSTSISLNIKYDNRDNTFFTGKGFLIDLSGKIFPKFKENIETFTKAEFDVRWYTQLGFLNSSIFALRAGGAKIWGKYPFYEACFVGGKDNLRSYMLERFAGDASLYFQSEMRIPIAQIKIIVKGDFGLLTFAETGRVFENGVKSDIWHPSYGTGVWFSIFKHNINFVYNIGFFKEVNTHYVQTKFGF